MKTAEEILKPHVLYLLPELFGDRKPVQKVTYLGALKAMKEYAQQALDLAAEEVGRYDRKDDMNHYVNEQSILKLKEQLK